MSKTITIGTDHGGIEIRRHLIAFLKEEGYTVIDHGVDTTDSVDYPDYAKLVGNDVATGKADLGVLICRTGVGMSIAANKIAGVRAALIHNEEDARLSREHNNANVICMGSSHEDLPTAQKFLTIFVTTEFEGGRHARRVGKMESCSTSC